MVSQDNEAEDAAADLTIPLSFPAPESVPQPSGATVRHLIDNPVYNLYHVLKEVVMERLNLNIPSEAREVLRRFAREANLREAEYARKLLLEQLKRCEREAFYRKVARAQTPAMRKRMLEIARGMEELRG